MPPRTCFGRSQFRLHPGVLLACALMLVAATAPALDCPEQYWFPFVGGDLSQHGGSVASAGDVNGDGYEDFIVGASEDLALGSGLVRPGEAYVFFGGPNADALPDMTMTGDKDTHWFGRSVDGIGDYNDDGFDDVIVGAPGNPDASPHSFPGDAYIYFGGPSPDSTADVHFSGENNDDGFGEEVSGIGDFNADGFPDIMIGAVRHDGEKGKVYVHFGGPGADLVADHSFTGSVAGEALGSELCAAGDMDGDGIADCAVGVQGYDDDLGRAIVFFGGPAANFQPGIVMTGTVSQGHFGRKLRGVGDINNDGSDDLAVGSFQDRVDIFFGASSTPDNVSDLEFLGPGDDEFGSSISTTDVNDDGFPDLVIGATAHGDQDSGRLYVYYGGPLLDLGADLILDGSEFSGGLGFDAASNIDWDSDGREDVIAGAPMWRPAETFSRDGAVFVFPGTALEDCNGNLIPDGCDMAGGFSGDCNGNGIPDECDIAGGFSNDCNNNGTPDECETILAGLDCNANGVPDYCDVGVVLGTVGQVSESEFGHDLATGGDFDGDGHEDLIVGEAGERSHIGPGHAYFFGGGPGLDTSADMIFTGEGTGDEFGASVDFIGDFNGDGHDDIVVGAPLNDSGPQDRGRAYVLFGGPGADNSADLILDNSGGGFGDKLGQVVAGAGDVNGDGFDDVLAGAPGAGVSNRLFLYYGGGEYSPGSLLQPAASYGIIGSGWTFPASMAGAGDLNGDQYADVVVGAYRSGGGISQVEVMLGGPSGLVSLTTLSGPRSNDHFGFSVAFAGDQNDDGIDDVLVGAPFDSFEGFQTGRAYLFFGGAGMDTDFDLEFSPPSVPQMSDGRFGISVAGGRDINGDGLDDMMIGQSAERHGTNAGRAHVFFGNAAGDVELDRLVVGSSAGAETGRDVKLAGDLNGDGEADFVVGAPSSDLKGRVDVFDVRATTFLDCNANGIGDACDIDSGVALDLNDNGVPDVCEATAVAPGATQLQLALRGATPNPFNPMTVLAFDLPSSGRVQIRIFDARGRHIRSLLGATMDAGSHQVRWDGHNDAGHPVASGVYFAQLSLEAGGRAFSASVMKLTLLK